jgi:hypothetical protein
MYLIVQTLKSYTDDTDEDQLCTSTDSLVQSLETNKHCNDRGLRLNLVISPIGGAGGEGGDRDYS